jgi:hypothetical protein
LVSVSLSLNNCFLHRPAHGVSLIIGIVCVNVQVGTGKRLPFAKAAFIQRLTLEVHIIHAGLPQAVFVPGRHIGRIAEGFQFIGPHIKIG